MYIGLHVKYTLFFFDLNETWIFQQIFDISSNIKFHEIPSRTAELFNADGRTEGHTDRHYEDNSRFSQFRERA